MYKLEKYKQHINQHKECEHKYRLMDSKTTQIQADNRQVSIHILGVSTVKNVLIFNSVERSRKEKRSDATNQT